MGLVKFLPEIFTAILVAMLSFGLHTIDVDRIEKNQVQAIADNTASLNKSCDMDKQLTENVDNAYTQNLTDLGSQLANFDGGLRGSTSDCIVPTSEPAGGGNGPALVSKPPVAHGVSSAYLLKLAAEGEQYRLQLKSCQDFVNKTWEEKGAK